AKIGISRWPLSLPVETFRYILLYFVRNYMSQAEGYALKYIAPWYKFLLSLENSKYLLFFISAILYPEILRFLAFYSGKMKPGLTAGNTIESGCPHIQGY